MNTRYPIKRRLMWLTLGCAVIGHVMAQPSLITRHLPDEATTTLSVSNNDLNRLYVDGDTITALKAPGGRMMSQDDRQGSVYFTTQGDKPFTVFISTVHHHHFGIRMTPKARPGVSLGLIPLTKLHEKRLTRVIHDYPKTYYTHQRVAWIRALMHHQAPNGFIAINASRRAHGGLHHVALMPGIRTQIVQAYANKKDGLHAFDMVLENTTRHDIALTRLSFKPVGVQVFAFTKPTLPPKGRAQLCLVVKDAG